MFDATHRREYERDLLRAREEERAARLRVERLQQVSGALASALTPQEVARAVRNVLPVEQAERVLTALEDADGRGAPSFGTADDGFLDAVLAQCMLALERSRLQAETARLYEHERDVARALQHSLLARAPLSEPRLAVEAVYQPGVRGLDVGGDWHDAFMLPSGRVGVVVGDVVGRGLEAASTMGQLKSAVRALATAGFEPGALLERLDAFVETAEATRMATVVYAELDLDRGVACMASAGHPPAVLSEPDAEPRLVWEGRSAPLGVYGVPTERPQVELPLREGTRLVLYTDGLVERRARPLDEGFDQLLAHAAYSREAPLAQLVHAVVTQMLAGQESPDDVCVLALQVSSPSRS